MQSVPTTPSSQELSFSSPQSRELVKQLHALKLWQQAALSKLLASQQQEREVLSLTPCNNSSVNPTPTKEEVLQSETLIPKSRNDLADHKYDQVEERPVGTHNKSFQELLDVKLKEEGGAASPNTSSGIPKKIFLKKGSGLKRFNVTTPAKSQPKKELTGFKRVVSPLKGKRPDSGPTIHYSEMASGGKNPPVKTVNFDDSVDLDLNVKFQQADRQHKKELKDLAVFELLENVADKSSFCSSSSIIARFMTEGSTSTPQVSRMTKPAATSPLSVHDSRHVRFADTFKYAEYTAEVESDSDTMVTSYGVDDLETDRPSPGTEKNLGESYVSRVVNKLRAQHGAPSTDRQREETTRYDSMVTNCDSAAIDSDKENSFDSDGDEIQFKVEVKPNAAITKEKIPKEVMSFSPPPIKKGLTPSHLIWEAFKEKASPVNSELNRVLQERSENTDAYTDIMKRIGLVGLNETNNPAAASAIHSRVLELEKEINVFRKETNLLRKSRKEVENLKVEVSEEKKRFEKQMENEKRRLQLQVEEEKKKLRSQEKQDAPVLKPSEELLELRSKVEELTTSNRTKEGRWHAEKTKLLSRIRHLESEFKVKSEELERLKKEEQELKKRLQSSLRPKPVYAQTRPPSRAVEVQTEPPELIAFPLETSLPSTPMKADLFEAPTPLSDKKGPNDAFRVTINDDGSKELLFNSGNVKTVYRDGTVKTVYYNKDVKVVLPDGTVKYTYAAKGVTQTTGKDGKEVFEYPEGHVETKFPSGRREVVFPGGCFAVFQSDGSEERQWPNGTKLWRDAKGNQALQMPNGDRETCTPTCKRRELPDGTLITTYPDGRKETRFPNGKVKVVDSQGQVIIDTRTRVERPENPA